MIEKLYKRLGITAIMLLMLSSVLYAQDRSVSGTVKDPGGNGMPGVNVVAKGTSTGTTTDADGKYTFTVNNNTVLVFSFIGFVTQEVQVGAQTTIDISMTEDVTSLSEVVVTALGIERDKKALQYSVTQINGDNFTQARENSMANALAGRVAGVNVTKVASGPAGSSRVVIRGAKSLGATTNQPLYVVDGIPMDNNNFGQAGVWGGADQGDGMTSMNPDDVQSISVLKGASAAALYGSRAANGVILITTKKGAARKTLGVEFNSNFVMEKVINLSDYQTSFGSGGMVGTTVQNRVATKATTMADLSTAWNGGWYGQAWGPRLDGSNVLHWDGKTRPYSNAGDNWDRYYQTGTQFTNSIALTGGSETQNFRFSMANLNSSGVIPNSGFDRINGVLSVNSKFGKKLSLNTKVMYSNEKAKNRPNLSDSPGNGVQGLARLAPDINVDDLKGDPNKLGAVPSLVDQASQGITIFDGKGPGEEYQIWSNLWGQNPWWTAYQFINTDKRDRVIGSGQLRYDITDFLYVMGSAGMDYYTLRYTRLTPQGTGYNRGGNMTEGESTNRETNFEYRIGFNKAFGEINVNAYLGGNRMRRVGETLTANGTGFSVPFFVSINNAAQRNYGYGFNEIGINSLYGSAEISFRNYVFLTGTMRNDWFSTLNDDYNSIPYPSVGASFVFSDAVNSLPEWLSFGKVRASWGQVGNTQSVGAYSVNKFYSLGNLHTGRAMAYFRGGANNGTNLPNPALVPFTSTETEFGFDVRFLQNKIGLDFTYYNQKTTDDILNAGISRTSGFSTTSVNLGELTNKGIEVLLTYTPVKGPLTWDVSLNLAHNKSNVVSLIKGQTQLNTEEPRTRTVFISHIVGQPYGMITGYKQRTTANGDLIYNADGAPLTDNTYQPIGNGVPKLTGGLTNSVLYKGINLTFLIDFKFGGDIYSGTNVRMTGAGFTKETLEGRAGETPMVRTGVFDANSDNQYTEAVSTKTYTPGEAQNYWGNLSNRAQENFIYDGSFIKLRQITLGYSIPKSLLSKTPINTLSVSLVSRNLAILMKNVPNIDPEAAYSSGNGQGLDYFGMPPTRTFGFNLNASF